MGAIPLPLTSLPGVKPQEGKGRLVNCYAEKHGDSVIIRGAPGLRQILDITGRTHCRGFIEVNGTLFVCLDTRLYTVTQSGGVFTAVDRGAVGGTDQVTFARNNKQPSPDICLVASSVAYQCFISANIAAWPDADVGSPNSVTSISGYFIWTYGDGKFRNSGLNDTTINTLDYATAESRPDTLYRGIPLGNDLLLFGSQTVEAWRNAGNANGSPFDYVTTIPRGLAGPFAVAGWEDGFANTIIWVGDDNVVYRKNGYGADRISTHPIERDIQELADKATLQAGVFMLAGHAFWALSSPAWTWVYDITTGGWHERQSSGSRWRASCFIKAFGSWVAGDVATGKLYQVDETYFRDGAVEISGLIETDAVKEFPSPFRVSRLYVDATKATGRAAGEDPIQTEPQCGVSWSRDGGYSWATPVLRGFGAQGESRRRMAVNELGTAAPEGFKVRLSWSTPSHVAFNSLSAEFVKLRA